MEREPSAAQRLVVGSRRRALAIVVATAVVAIAAPWPFGLVAAGIALTVAVLDWRANW